MLRVYYLPVEPTLDGERVLGAALIHHGVLECTEAPDIRKLLMDTVPHEHLALEAIAILVRQPTLDEIDRFNAREVEPPPDADTIRAREILATSPDVISMPEVWELVRIFGKRLGY